jgi:hypothetical protein
VTENEKGEDHVRKEGIKLEKRKGYIEARESWRSKSG